MENRNHVVDTNVTQTQPTEGGFDIGGFITAAGAVALGLLVVKGVEWAIEKATSKDEDDSEKKGK